MTLTREERLDDLPTALLVALQGWQRGIWTALPGIVESYDTSAMTCKVKPALMIPITQDDGSIVHVNISLLLDVPIVFPSGGGYTLTFPITAGDEVLVIFSSRCINTWWARGGFENHLEDLRMHDLSDGFAIPSPFSQPKKLAALSTTSCQLRSNDGAAYVEVAAGHVVNVVAPGSVTITSPTVIVNSTTATVNASGVATISAPSIILKNAGTALKKLVNDTFVTLFNSHVHSGVTGGIGNTGAPTVTAGATTTTSTVQAE